MTVQLEYPGDTIPHSLAVACRSLIQALNEAITAYEETQRFPDSAFVISTVERLVHELGQRSEWMAEVQRRASLVQTSCGPGSVYEKAREAALAAITSDKPDIYRGSLALRRLRKAHTPDPGFLTKIAEVRNNIEAVLEEPSLGLTPKARQALLSWREESRRILLEAERLEADGCWFLYHLYLAGKSDCSEESSSAKAIMQTHMGGANLASLRAAAHSIVAWIRESAASGFANQPEAVEEHKQGTKSPSRGVVPKRSWTQRDLNEAILEYKAARSSTYNDLVDGVRRGMTGAIRDARRLFGRNQIARELGVRSRAMVTKSPVWQQIADELRLREHSGPRRRSKRQCVGMDIALETQAMADCDPVVDETIRRETIRMVEKSMPNAEAEATIEKLQRREITDEQAREIAQLRIEQDRDRQTRRSRQVP